MKKTGFIILIISFFFLLSPGMRADEGQNEDRKTVRFDRLTIEDGLLRSAVLSIIQDKKGFMWFADGSDLIKYDGVNVTVYSHNPRAPYSPGCPGSEYVRIVAEDPSGVLWLGTMTGLDKFDPETESFTRFPHDPGNPAGIGDNNVYAVHRDRSGILWAGTSRGGLNRFDPGAGSPLQKHISYTEEITLSYEQTIFSLEFAALDYTHPRENQYKYMVPGLHDHWIDLGHKHEIAFTGLDPGEYILRVKGSNNDGTWNEQGAFLRITVTPPFWQTWWFRTLSAVFLLTLIYVWHQNRMKHLSLRLKTESEMNRFFEKYNISKREQEILHLIVKGKTNRDIEAELYISVKTVKNHVYNIYQKLGVNTRLELIHCIQKSVKLT